MIQTYMSFFSKLSYDWTNLYLYFFDIHMNKIDFFNYFFEFENLKSNQ
jgi:hypothetical protein